MPTFAFVALSMLLAGIGGALATWGSIYWMYSGLEPQPAEVLRSLTALGGVFAGFCGGLASIYRGHKANLKDFKGGLATIGLGLGVIAVINPGFLFSPFLLVIAPVQGLSALVGGFVTVASLWAVLRMAGIRDGTNLKTFSVGGGKVEPSDAADSR
jgi:hypothetical protein